MLAVSLTGCALLANQKSNWDACQADAECRAKASSSFAKGNLAGAKLGDKSGVAGGAAGGGIVGGGLAYLFTALYYGSKLRKRRKEH